MESMRIIQTPARFYPFIGGVENYVHSLSKELVRLGQEVQIICAREPKTRGLEGGEGGIEIKRLSYIGKVANTNITPALPFALSQQDFDLIHTHLPTPWSADWSYVMSKLKRRPLVLTYHNDIVGQGLAGQLASFYNLTGLQILLKASAKIVITQDKYISSSLYLKSYKNKIKVVPNGVDIDKFRPINRLKKKGDSRVLFFLGILDRYHAYKGLDDLIKALSMVRKQMPGVKLVVGGDGELLKHYRDVAASLGLSRSVEFRGFIPDEKLPKCYSLCDAFVLPSVSSEQEGFGIVLLEAMASGLPVISTDIVGVAEDVKKFNAGRIVRPRDINALAQAILEVLSDEELAREMGRRGRALVELKYDWNKIGRDMLEIYRGLV